MAHQGGCLCGQVRYVADSEPLGARMCWCRDCQRIASGSATVNALFDEQTVRFTGGISTFDMIADSGNKVERGFCSKCGSQMYSRTVEPKGQPMRLRAGTLDDPEIVTPSALIWVDSAPSWAPLDPALPWHAQGPHSPLSSRAKR
ncbi:MAG: GFA family protein [Sphingomonadales bacterium]|nr:GFA family protein [Sphingomonadales bacterium]